MGKIEINGMDSARHPGKNQPNKQKGAETQNVPVKPTSLREYGEVLRKCRHIWKGTSRGVKSMRLIKSHML